MLEQISGFRRAFHDDDIWLQKARAVFRPGESLLWKSPVKNRVNRASELRLKGEQKTFEIFQVAKNLSFVVGSNVNKTNKLT